MEHLTIPEGYQSPLTIRETEVAIKEIKDQLNEETYDYHKAEELIQRLVIKKENAPKVVPCDCVPGQCECHLIG